MHGNVILIVYVFIELLLKQGSVMGSESAQAT